LLGRLFIMEFCWGDDIYNMDIGIIGILTNVVV
jgi:hypothetical protein